MSLSWLWGSGGLLCHSYDFPVTWSKDFLSRASVSLFEKRQMDQRTIGQCLSNFNVHTGDLCVCVCVCVCVRERERERESLSRVRLFVTPRTVACQVPLSMEFST